MRRRKRWERIGSVVVDSGCVAVVDPGAFHDHLVENDHGALVNEHDVAVGVAVDSGYGDGVYPVEARRAGGRVAEIRVRFIPHPALSDADLRRMVVDP